MRRPALFSRRPSSLPRVARPALAASRHARPLPTVRAFRAFGLGARRPAAGTRRAALTLIVAILVIARAVNVMK